MSLMTPERKQYAQTAELWRRLPEGEFTEEELFDAINEIRGRHLGDWAAAAIERTGLLGIGGLTVNRGVYRKTQALTPFVDASPGSDLYDERLQARIAEENRRSDEVSAERSEFLAQAEPAWQVARAVVELREQMKTLQAQVAALMEANTAAV